MFGVTVEVIVLGNISGVRSFGIFCSVICSVIDRDKGIIFYLVLG